MMYLPDIPIGAIVAGAVTYLLLIAGLGAWLAEKKGYSSGGWFFICFLTGPIGLIALAGAPGQGTESSLREIKKQLEGQGEGKASDGDSNPAAS